MSAVRLSVAAPCYNEAESIEAVVARWDEVLAKAPLSSEIVLCNDGSTDGTAAVLERLQRRFPRLRVVSFEQNGGYGRALSAAIDATRGEHVVTIDSDGQFELADGLALLEELQRGGHDCVTGWRMGKKDNLFRVAMDRGLNLLVRALFGVRLRDTNCALKVARGEVLRGLRIEARGYPTPTEIVVRLAAKGCKVGEKGVSHLPRAGGASKLHPWRTAWSMFRFLLYLRGKLKLFRARIIVEP
ncbi:MAG TPA: glycosyltransferase family 2 protein [Planctomycetota bacterium]|nr:glycosyltransferase family 2 protein [Planctomycetota bacterium]